MPGLIKQLAQTIDVSNDIELKDKDMFFFNKDLKTIIDYLGKKTAAWLRYPEKSYESVGDKPEQLRSELKQVLNSLFEDLTSALRKAQNFTVKKTIKREIVDLAEHIEDDGTLMGMIAALFKGNYRSRADVKPRFSVAQILRQLAAVSKQL